MDCYWVRAVPNLNPKPSHGCLASFGTYDVENLNSAVGLVVV